MTKPQINKPREELDFDHQGFDVEPAGGTGIRQSHREVRELLDDQPSVVEPSGNSSASLLRYASTKIERVEENRNPLLYQETIIVRLNTNESEVVRGEELHRLSSDDLNSQISPEMSRQHTQEAVSIKEEEKDEPVFESSYVKADT